ncbi:MAG: hypothetical protein HYY06_13385 [Deltaproteobacteria bacterium]|nr:hypothetical protein [Deltaproteobacteria bacterium]
MDDETERRELAALIAGGEIGGLPARELITRAAGALRRGPSGMDKTS